MNSIIKKWKRNIIALAAITCASIVAMSTTSTGTIEKIICRIRCDWRPVTKSKGFYSYKLMNSHFI